MKVLFITWSGHRYARQRLQRLKDYHEDRGDQTQWTHFNASDFDEHLESGGLAYMWNGQYELCAPIKKKLTKAGMAIHYVEIAWFPQDEYLYFDSSGTNSDCSLFQDELDWLTVEDYQVLNRFAAAYRQGAQWFEGDYIFVPLQLSHDMQVRHGGTFQNMSEFITHVRHQFPEQRVIFRKHPKDGGTYDIGDDGSGDLRDLLLNCKAVYGINSTVTLEAALMGVPVTVIGKSLLNIGESRKQALAALLARQVPVNATDFSPWTRTGRGLEHLAA